MQWQRAMQIKFQRKQQRLLHQKNYKKRIIKSADESKENFQFTCQISTLKSYVKVQEKAENNTADIVAEKPAKILRKKK